MVIFKLKNLFIHVWYYLIIAYQFLIIFFKIYFSIIFVIISQKYLRTFAILWDIRIGWILFLKNKIWDKTNFVFNNRTWDKKRLICSHLIPLSFLAKWLIYVYRLLLRKGGKNHPDWNLSSLQDIKPWITYGATVTLQFWKGL